MESGSITSADGTTVGYRRFGAAGPAVVLLHGGGQSGRNLQRLAAALAADFTVYVPDRRGRGASGPAGDGYGAATERADLAALLAHAGAGLWPLGRANRRRPADHDPRALILTMGLDAQLVADSEGTLDAYRTVAVPVLLLGGTRSPGYLQRTLRRLADVLPAATLKVLPGAGHTAPDNSGRPAEVAAEVMAFFQIQPR